VTIDGKESISSVDDTPVSGAVAAARPWLKSYPDAVDWHAQFNPKPFQSLLDEAALRFADQPCIDFLDRQMTYREVDQMATKVASGLQDLGVGKGSKVGLFLPNCPYSIVCFFGVLRAGGTVVNYNPLYVTREIEQQVIDSDTEIMITLDLKALLPKLEPLVGKGKLKAIVVANFAACLPFPKSLFYRLAKRGDIARIPDAPAFVAFDQLIANDGYIEPVSIIPEEDIALIQYTGGTTGVPKGAVHTHASLVVNAAQIEAWAIEFEPGKERILGVIPLFHVLAISTVLTLGVRTGAVLILLPRFDPDQMLQTVHQKHPTFLPGVPTIFNAISSHPKIDSFDLTSIKFCISGGAPLPIEVKDTFERRAGCALVEGYGLTEAPVTHCNPFSGVQKLGSFGLPMPGTTIEILSVEDGETVLPSGERGEVCVSGPQIMQGYWQRLDETATTIRKGRLHTGDIGYLDEDGYGFLVDRLKDLIICSGFNVYPRIVEEALYEHEDVLEAAVCGIPDDYRGETVKAYVVAKEGTDLDETKLLTFLKDRLSPIEMPKFFAFRSELPKSAVGKILKRELLREEQEQKVAG